MDKWSIPTTLWAMVIGIERWIGKTSTQILVSAVTLFVLYIFYRIIKKIDSKEKWLVILNILAPFAGAILFFLLARLKGQSSSVFLVRYFLFSSTFISIAIALWLITIRKKKIAYVLLALYAAVNIFAISNYWNELDVASKPGMAAASSYLANNVEPGHKIFVGSSFEFFNYKYYNSTPVRPLLYSGGNRTIESLPHYAGTAILTNEDLVPSFDEATTSGDTVWLLWTNGFGGSKPEVPKNWTQIHEEGFAEVRPYVGTWVIVTEYKTN
jgi:hypothetical protein